MWIAIPIDEGKIRFRQACPRHQTSKATTIRFQCIVLLSNHSLKDWTTLSEWTLSTLTFKNPASMPLAIRVLLITYWSCHKCLPPKSFQKSHGLMQHTRSPWTKSKWILKQDSPNCLHLAPQYWQQPHWEMFEGGPALQSGHYIWWSSFSATTLLPLWDLAPPSVSSACILSSTPSAACLHKCNNELLILEELTQ